MPQQLVVKDLHELYESMGLSSDAFESSSGFTIHFLQDTFKNLPFTSVPFRPNYFSFLFVREAFGKYTIDDLSFTVQPGTVYFTNPGNYRIFEWHKIVDTCLITFNETYLVEYVHDQVYREFPYLLTETVEPRVLGSAQFDAIKQLYSQINIEYHGTSPYKNKIIGSLTVALLLKIKEYFFQDYNPIYEGNRRSQIVKTFKLNLESHFRELLGGKTDKLLRVQDFADMQSLHANYLSSVIAAKTGKSVSTWIADKITTEARILLHNQSLSVKEIANKLGFSEASHFSNHFKKHTTMSPLEYRKHAP
jgi:AraC family transcriptional activator of pobA